MKQAGEFKNYEIKPHVLKQIARKFFSFNTYRPESCSLGLIGKVYFVKIIVLAMAPETSGSVNHCMQAYFSLSPSYFTNLPTLEIG